MHTTETVVTRRKGGVYEAIGTVLVVVGMLAICAHPAVGIPIAGVGFVVFLVGRFM